MQQPRRSMYGIAIAIAIASSASYHVIQRATPSNVNPVMTLLVTYTVAFVVCLGLLPFFPLTTSVQSSFGQLNWASYALAATVIGSEVGFLLAYRAGWNISIAALVVTIGATIILIPISVLIFGEHLSFRQVLGILVCLIGLVLINWK